MAVVTDFKVTKIVPKVPKEYADLLPRYPLEKITFKLSNASNAVANAFRRCPDELVSKHLTCTSSDIETDDEYIINEFIVMRIKSIPLQQDVKSDTTWELSVANNTTDVIDIMTDDIAINCKVKPFNNQVLCTLNSGKRIYITGVIGEGRSFNDGFGMTSLTALCSSTVHDVSSLPNSFEDHEGIPSRRANRLEWNLSLMTNGQINANVLMKQICDSIISRANAVKKLEIISTNDLHEVIIIDETHTLGSLMIRECESVSSIKYYAYRPDPTSFGIRFEFRCDEDPEIIIKSLLDSIVHKFEHLRTQF